MCYQFSVVPVQDLLNDGRDEIICCSCKKILGPSDEVVLDGDGDMCVSCAKDLAEKTEKQSLKFAAEQCKLTGAVPVYDPSKERTCTRDEYESGFKESYSVNSFLAHCRHNLTNYDALIRDCQRDTILGEIYYAAIRNRIEELLRIAGVDADALREISESHMFSQMEIHSNEDMTRDGS